MELISEIANCELRIANFQSDNPKPITHNPQSVAGISIVLVLLALAVLLCMPATTMACPLCKEALFDPGQIHQKLSLAKGYAVSIVFMLAMPLALLGGVAALIVRAHHKGRD